MYYTLRLLLVAGILIRVSLAAPASESETVAYYRLYNPAKGIASVELQPDSLIGEYYEIHFSADSQVVRAVYYDRHGRPVRAYEPIWQPDKENFFRYRIIFFRAMPLTRLDPHLYVPDASEIRPGWRALVTLNLHTRRAEKVVVKDRQGILYYFYTFRAEGSTARPQQWLTTARYYRADSTLIGSHQLQFDGAAGLQAIWYYDENQRLLRSKEYAIDHTREEMRVTVKDSTGRIMERRIVPRTP